MNETENNGDFSKWPYTVMQTLDDRIGEPRGYKMIPLEDRKQGLENIDHEFKHGCFQNCTSNHSEFTCEHRDVDCNRCGKFKSEHRSKVEYFMSENPDLIF